MATLEEKISALEAEIAEYRMEYQNATSEEKKDIRPLIIACRNNLNILLQQQQQPQGE
jgi:hypothetical protein